MYKVSNYYAPAHDGGIRWDDPEIAIPWPIGNRDVIVSEKDRQLPYLRGFDSPFAYDGHPLLPMTVAELS
jgi:dTDP-4-dehydrorhamnose 3,5-epimerase